jgi:hypothetical protein
MSTHIEIERSYFQHEDRTKFYQVWTIERGPRSLAFTQWGKEPEHKGMPRLSIGSCKLHTSKLEALNKAREKRGRGYYETEHSRESVKPEGLQGFLEKRGFTAGQITSVFETLRMDLVEKAEKAAPAAPKNEFVRPRAAPEFTPTAETNKEWGTW